MKIKMIQEDIDKANMLIQDDGNLRSHCCPVAIAVARILQNKQVVAYGSTLIVNRDKVSKQIYKLSQEARTFIFRYDLGKKVLPIEFELRPKTD